MNIAIYDSDGGVRVIDSAAEVACYPDEFGCATLSVNLGGHAQWLMPTQAAGDQAEELSDQIGMVVTEHILHPQSMITLCVKEKQLSLITAEGVKQRIDIADYETAEEGGNVRIN